MAKKGGKSSAATKAQRAAYQAENRAKKNREARLAKHLKTHEGDEQAVKALARGKGHVRKKPKTKKVHAEFQGYRVVGTDEKDKEIWAYVSRSKFLPGHPVLTMLKKGKAFSEMRLRDIAAFSQQSSSLPNLSQ